MKLKVTTLRLSAPIVRASACAALALGLGAACSSMVTKEWPRLAESASRPAIEAPAPIIVTAVTPPHPVSASPATSEQPPHVPDPKAPTSPRTGAPGKTKGTISCGTVRCNASTHDCDWDVDQGQWACVPQAAEPGLHLVSCDDASDCSAGEFCYLGPGGVYACRPRSEQERWQIEVCQEGGAPCPRGTFCDRSESMTLLDDENGIEGLCTARARATCAKKERCPEERPVCVISSTPGEPPTCEPEISSAVRGLGALAFRCTRQGDCDGGMACVFGERSRSAHCAKWEGGTWNPLVCDPGGNVPRLPSEAERKRVCGGNAECRDKLRCFPTDALPWLGALTTSSLGDLRAPFVP